MVLHIRTEQPVFFLLVKLRDTSRRNLLLHIPGGGARLEDQGATADELEYL